MKKLLSVLAAAVLCCTALGTPVLAAETDEPVYQFGDVNMDGKIDCCDALLALQYYVNCMAMNDFPVTLTEQQIQLANVDKESYTYMLSAYFTEEPERITWLENWFGTSITETADGDYGYYKIYTVPSGSRFIAIPYEFPVTALDAQYILMYYVYYVLLYPDGEMTIAEFLHERYPDSEWNF